MPRFSTFVTVLVTALIFGCSTRSDRSEDEFRSEVNNFMTEYAADIGICNAEGVAARYNRLGAYVMGNGRKEFKSYDSIRLGYINEWDCQEQPSFEIKDLSFEILSADAVLVSGRFDWSRGDSMEAQNFSYTGILIRQDGELRILLEDESLQQGIIN